VQNSSPSVNWSKAIVIGTALTTAFIGLSFSETESASSINKQFSPSVITARDLKKMFVYDSVSTSIPWLNEFYKSALSVSRAKQIYPLVSGIRGLFVNQEYSKVDDILNEMDHSKLSHTAMVAFITSTFPARDKLVNWHVSVERVKLSLERDGLNAEDILQGLI
jgi:hypothetical protein